MWDSRPYITVNPERGTQIKASPSIEGESSKAREATQTEPGRLSVLRRQ